MTITCNFHDPKSAEFNLLTGIGNASLGFKGDGIERVALFVPPHVAEHTAAAFNRAMQAVPDGDGWTYTTKSGVWHISRDLAMGTVYHAQHEDVTGDEDPAYLFADAVSLIGCMDAIDDIEDENACSECHALVGDNTFKADANTFLCTECFSTEDERQAGMREMADDDKAHAAMERAAGL
jgi:hypothetical protein